MNRPVPQPLTDTLAALRAIAALPDDRLPTADDLPGAFDAALAQTQDQASQAKQPASSWTGAAACGRRVSSIAAISPLPDRAESGLGVSGDR